MAACKHVGLALQSAHSLRQRVGVHVGLHVIWLDSTQFIKTWLSITRFSFDSCVLGAGSVRDGAMHAHDAILEMLNLHEGGMQKLGNSQNDTARGAASTQRPPSSRPQ